MYVLCTSQLSLFALKGVYIYGSKPCECKQVKCPDTLSLLMTAVVLFLLLLSRALTWGLDRDLAVRVNKKRKQTVTGDR